MRTTLNIDDDVLEAAKEVARRERRTVGQVVSALVRGALTDVLPKYVTKETPAGHAFRPFPAGNTVITKELVDELRDRVGY